MPITLPKGSILKFDGNALTEHNRRALTVDIERIETADRMANGSMRKYVIADKKKWSTSWELVPSVTAKTVDGKWGGDAMHTFYKATPGVFVLTVGIETFNAFITEFSYDVIARGTATEAWNISLSLEEA